jgi:hypothetical protein
MRCYPRYVEVSQSAQWSPVEGRRTTAAGADGKGVPADKTLAQNWHAKAQSCQDGNLALLQQQISRYRARAAAAREPMLSAIPVIPKSAPPVARNGHGSGASANSDILVGIAVVVVAMIALGAENSENPDIPDINAQMAVVQACSQSISAPFATLPWCP